MAKKILIVEDNELNMKLFHDLLEVHGYETLQTKDGREVLKLARDERPTMTSSPPEAVKRPSRWFVTGPPTSSCSMS